MFRLGASYPSEEERSSAISCDFMGSSFAEMNYPFLGRGGAIEGPVIVRVTLDDTGKVVSAELITGHPLLARDALANARKWRFRPGGTKTAVIIYEFQFADGTCGATLNQLFVFREPNIASIAACPSHAQLTSQ